MKTETNQKSPIKIEKGVPVPKHNGHIDSFASEIRKMSVGDSFLMKSEPYKINSIYAIFRQIGFKATARKMHDGTHRIWRKA